MKIRWIQMFSLMFYLFGFSHYLWAENNNVNFHVIAYSQQDNRNEGKYHVGKIAQVYIYSDSIRDKDDPKLAIIRMDDLNRDNPEISLVRVYLYQKECTGTPQTFFQYAEVSHKQAIMPQVFAISEKSCVEIEFYRTKGEDNLELLDNFQIEVI